MTAVYKKELRSYFTGMTGAIFMGFLLLLAGIFMTSYNLKGLYPFFEYALSGVSFLYLLAVPVLTMRSVAEEKHLKTDQLLYSLPLSMSEIVLAKYFAMVTVLALPCGILCLYPLLLTSFGNVHLASTYAYILAFFLLGCALIAIGLFISSLTESQVIAAVVSLGAMVLLYFTNGIASLIPMTATASYIGVLVLVAIVTIVVQILIKNVTFSSCTAILLAVGCSLLYLFSPTLYEGLIPSLLNRVALFNLLSTFTNGMFDLSVIILYLSVAGLFVYLTVQSMEKKRWN